MKTAIYVVAAALAGFMLTWAVLVLFRVQVSTDDALGIMLLGAVAAGLMVPVGRWWRRRA